MCIRDRVLGGRLPGRVGGCRFLRKKMRSQRRLAFFVVWKRERVVESKSVNYFIHKKGNGRGMSNKDKIK